MTPPIANREWRIEHCGPYQHAASKPRAHDSRFAIRDLLKSKTPRRHRPNPMAIRRAQGFTLIELVASFVIFALGFGVLLQILSGALHTTTQSADYTKAAMWAQSLLDTQGIGEPLQEGGSSGRFDDRFSWDLAITRYEPPPVQTTAQQLTTSDANGLITTPITPLDLFRLELVVHWGTPYLMHHARFSTVRVMNPPLQAGNNIPPAQPIRARQ